jgi:nucleotide-binding universal stress UspA family protein
MYTKILVPLDGSDLASAVLPHVRELVHCTHAGIVLLCVVPESAFGVDGWTEGQLERREAFRDSDVLPSVAERRETEVAMNTARSIAPDALDREVAAYRFLDTIVGNLERSGIHAQPRVKIAAPAEAILDVADEEGVDLIAMSTHGRSGIGRFMLGSVADRVVHHARVPVLLVRSKDVGDQKSAAPITYKKILVPLDGSDLANTVLPYAREMALCTGAEVLLLQAITEPGFEVAETELMFAAGGITPSPESLNEDPGEVAAGRSRRQATARTGSGFARQIEYATEAAQSNLSAAAAALTGAGIRVETEVQVGRPAAVILDVATSSGADMIAMATHGRSGIRRFLMGSVADRVVRHAHTPVLLVRPVHP